MDCCPSRLGGLFALVLALCVLPVHAQSDPDSAFSPSDVWSTPLPADGGRLTRSGTGRPGPTHWQNRASYQIEATLDTSAKTLQGHVNITYTNNSPDPLSSIWLLLAPSTSAHRDSALHVRVNNVTVHRQDQSQEPDTYASDARLQVRLPTPLDPGGSQITLKMRFEVSLPPDNIPGHARVPSGPLYNVGHWFPHVAAYSDQHGWATPAAPTHAEYASFNYDLTVPASYIIAGSGVLLNPGDVLTEDQRRRLNRARDNSRKVAIIAPNNAGTADTRPAQSGMLTWKFGMNGVRTVAWAASPSFIWNAAQFDRGGQRNGLAMSYYPPSGIGGEAWNRSTYHLQEAVQFYGRKLQRYPWVNTINVAVPDADAAFPGLSMCPVEATGYRLFSCSIQHQSHNWFPTIIGSNPDRHPWLSDGLATFLSTLAHQHLYEGEFAPKNDQQYAPGQDTIPARAMAAHMQDATTPILAPPSSHTASTPRYTFKPAFGLHLLREYVLSPAQFDYALRQFAERWAYKSATPQDLFRTFEDATGTELSWFWKGWFATNWQIDLAIQDVTYPDDDPKNGARITFALEGAMPMPIRATVTHPDGTKRSLRLPVEVWRDGPMHTRTLDTTQPLQRVEIDPTNKLPDTKPANNTWTAPSP